MQAYIKTMAWGFWRERRLHIACLIAIAGAFSVFMSEYHALFEHYESVKLLMVFALLIEGFGLGGFIALGCSTPSMRFDLPVHLSTKPLSSRMLVGIYLGLTISCVIVLHLIITLLYRVIGHVDWPVLVPLIGLITFVLCAYAAFWSLSGSPVLLGITGIVIYGLAFGWCKEHLSGDKASWIYILRHVLPYAFVIWVLAVAISVLALDRARHGERFSSARFWKRIYAWLEGLVPEKNWELQSPQKAYFWLLLRTRGSLMPMVNLLGVIAALVMCAYAHDSIPDIQEFILGFAFVNLFGLPFFGMLLFAHPGETPSSSYTIAARPLSNRCILLATLRSFLASYAIGWIVYILGLVLVHICFLAAGDRDTLTVLFNELRAFISSAGPEVLIYGLVFLAAYGLVFWAVVGLAASLALAGRKWPILALCAALFVVPNIIVFAEFFGGDMSGQLVKGFLAWLFALASILGSVGAFLLAHQRRFVPPLLTGCLLLGYLICCVVGASIGPFHISGPTETALLCGLLTLPFAPFATAPLALHWNRHR